MKNVLFINQEEWISDNTKENIYGGIDSIQIYKGKESLTL